MLVKGALPRGKSSAKVPRSDENRIGRLTFYTTPEKEFAVRYIALMKRETISKLLNEELDAIIERPGVNPATLPKTNT